MNDSPDRLARQIAFLLELDRLKTVRAQVPCLAHRQLRVPEAGPDGVLP